MNNIEIISNEDGTKSEKLTQKVCKVCRKLELRCRCAHPNIEEVVTLRPYVETPSVDPIVQQIS